MTKLVHYPGPGCLVEFMQGNAPQIAWVMEEQNGKLRLLLPNRRESNLPASRLLPWSGPQFPSNKSKDDISLLLQEKASRRAELAKDIDPLEIWEMVQGEVDKAAPAWLAELAFSDPDVDRIAALGQCLLGCKTHFRFNPPEFEIYSAETVENKMAAEAAAAVRAALVDGGAAWFKALWEAYQKQQILTENSKLAPDESVRLRLAQLLKARILNPQSQEDESLWKQLSKSLPDDPHLPLFLATAWGLVPEHYNFWLDRAGYAAGNDWSGEFLPQIQALEASLQELAQKPENSPLEETFISIDGPSTKDIDDAFSVRQEAQGWRICVALACPALNWPFGSPLDEAVLGRATSLYLPEGSYHMLPENLSLNAYSLLAQKKRPAMLLRCLVQADGSLSEIEAQQAWVNLAANLNYGDCQAVLDNRAEESNPAQAFAPQLQAALALAQARRQRRISQGAVIIERPDADCRLEEIDGQIKVSLCPSEEAADAQFLVQEIMILSNAALAAWGQERHLPLLYRVQDVDLPPEYAGVWHKAEDIAKVVKSMIPASLESQPGRHAGMGLSAYITATSPLRRYQDLINEAQIIHFLQEGQPLWDSKQSAALLQTVSLNLDAAGQVQRFRPRYWKLVYLLQESGPRGEKRLWPARVGEVNDNFVSLSLEKEQVLVRGKRKIFGEKVFPGQIWLLRLGKINALRNEISILEAQPSLDDPAGQELGNESFTGPDQA